MTVAELRAALALLPGDDEVLVESYDQFCLDAVAVKQSPCMECVVIRSSDKDDEKLYG